MRDKEGPVEVLVYVISVAMLVAWVWGVVRAARSRQFGWLTAMVLIPPVAWFYVLVMPTRVPQESSARR
jgi:NADH:ubiquinone oxidoreductase subunit 6 (subunit J)